MRIISGKLKGSSLYMPKNKTTRPLKDIVRESVFNLLKHSNKISFKIEKSHILDLYSGTGSFGLECLSRQAQNVYFVEKEKNAINLVNENIIRCEAQSDTTVIQGTYPAVFEDERRPQFDLMFFDPPYGFNERKIGDILSASFHNLRDGGKVIIETTKRNAYSEVDQVVFERRVRSGDSALDFYVKERA